MIIRQLRIFRCRALNISVRFRALWATSRDGSPKVPFPSIRFLVLRGYFLVSALGIDFCTRGVRYSAWFDGLQAGMNAAIAGMAAPVEILLRAGVEPNTTLVELRYSVVSDNFPVARASLILSLSSTLDRTTLKLKAGGD